MKDIVITGKRLRLEGLIFTGCFIVAFLLNVFSIVFYKTEWKELYTQLLWVICLSCLIYFLFLVLRLLYFFLKRIFVAIRNL